LDNGNIGTTLGCGLSVARRGRNEEMWQRRVGRGGGGAAVNWLTDSFAFFCYGDVSLFTATVQPCRRAVPCQLAD